MVLMARWWWAVWGFEALPVLLNPVAWVSFLVGLVEKSRGGSINYQGHLFFQKGRLCSVGLPPKLRTATTNGRGSKPMGSHFEVGAF